MLISGAFGLLGLILVSFWTTRKEQGPESVAVQGPTDAPSEPSPPPSFAPLRIESSGRLPQKAQGLQLGMTIADALQVQSDLKTPNRNVRVNPFAPEALLFGKTSRGFSNDLMFKNGRLISIAFELANLNPDDATVIRADTLQQLGPPTMEVWDFLEFTQLVWIDGDVRIAYQDSALSGSGQARSPKLTLADWPIYRRELLTSKMRDFEIHGLLVNWADQSATRHSLPRDLAGLSLGMATWQMRAALGSEGLDRPVLCNAGCDCWQKSVPDNRVVAVTLWRDKVMEISESWEAIQPTHLQSLIQRALAEYGTAVQPLTWTDGKVKLTCVEPLEATGPGPAEWSCNLVDLDLYRARNAETDNLRASQFNAAPDLKSFF